MNKHRFTLTVCAVAGLAFATGFVARPALQPDADDMEAMTKATTPDEHHKALQPLIGEWDAHVKMWMAPDEQPSEATGTVSREWIMDGRFVMEQVTATMPAEQGGGEFHGMGILGYNTVENNYESMWIENMATYMSYMTGKMDTSKKTMTFTGDQIDPMTGKRQATRQVVDISNPRKEIMTGYCTGPDGKEFKCFEGTLERKD